MSEDFRIRFYERQTAGVVDRLRALADQIEREAKPYAKAGITGTPRYLAAAEAVNHALTWGIANVGAYRLFDAAHHADEAEADATKGGREEEAV
jgi:hypothetical protein